jgi:hypothetical protein
MNIHQRTNTITKREILSLSFILIGIYCLVKINTMLPLFWNNFFYLFHYSRAFGINIYVHVIGDIIRIVWWIGLVYLFFRYSDYLAERFILTDTEIVFNKSTHIEKSLFPLSLIIIGVGCCIVAVPDILKNLSNMFDHNSGQTSTKSFYITIGSMVLLAIGVYLATGGEHLVTLAFREKRKPEPEEPDDRDS